ncbi:MAG: hypothetical protein K8E66_12160, partial [Phycisphaerales bacterium]|nr:hypothetical protein [Phycisphaerales bacterium]
MYTTGRFYLTVDFDPGAGTANLTAAGNNDIFVSKLDSSGAYVWAKKMGGSDSDFGQSVAVDTSGKVYTTGQFQGTADFDPGAGTANLTSVGSYDIFVSQLSGPPPAVSAVTRLDADPTNASSVDYSVSFNQSVTGVDASDFVLTATGTVTGPLVTGVSGSGATYTVTVGAGTGDGTLRLDVADDDTIIDGASQPLGGPGAGNGAYTSGEVYTIDKTAPASPSVTGTTPTNDSTPTWSWTAGGGGNGTFRHDLDTSGTWTETTDTFFTPGSALSAGNHSLKVQERDGVGNWSADSFFDIFVDITPPGIAISAPSATDTNTGPVSYTVTYTGADAVNLVNGDVTLNATGDATGTIGVTNGTTATPTVTISGITGNGTLGISIGAGTASDNAGNTAPAAGPSTTFNVDNTAPTIAIGAPSATDTNTGPVSFTVTYTDADAVNFANGDVTLNATGDATGTVGVTNGTTATPTVTISGITGNGTLGISIGAGTASDNAGNTAPAAGPSATFNVDNTAPAISVDSLTTSDTTPALTGTVDDNAADIEVTVNGQTNPATNNGDGTWTLADNTLTVLPDGTYNVMASATDAVGNVGNDLSTNELTVDTAAPT